MADKKKKKRKYTPRNVEVKSKPEPTRELYNREALERFALLVDGKLGERALVSDWDSDFEALAQQGLVKYVQRGLELKVWLTPKGHAELTKKR